MRAPRRSVTVFRALAGGIACVLASCAQSAPASSPTPEPTGSFSSGSFEAPSAGPFPHRRRPPGAFAFPRPQSATVEFGAHGGRFSVGVSSFGKKFTVDPTKLHFVIRPWNATTEPAPFGAQVGPPVLERSSDQARPPGTMTVYSLAVVFPTRPVRPGMYDVTLQAERDLARYDDGTELPVGSWGRSDVYWPDEGGADPSLRAAREAIENRVAYGYGGLVISCHRSLYRTYLADVGVQVRTVERRHDTVERMWTGSMTSQGNDQAYSFLDVDPLVVHADYPSAKWFSFGGGGTTDDDAPCPGFTIADPWQIGVTLTTVEPPPLPSGYDQFKIAVGMSRDDVARRRGYPQGYFTRAQLDARSVWEYDEALMDQFTVTFRNGRVASFTVPRGLP
jgi:hypothetical protein